MGFDHNECVVCYCNGMGNEKACHEIKVCFNCIIDLKVSSGASQRVCDTLAGNLTMLDQCHLCCDCEDNRSMGFDNVGFCDECFDKHVWRDFNKK